MPVPGLKNVEDETIWHHAGSGAMTGVMASFVLCPMELVKCRLQALRTLSTENNTTIRRYLQCKI